MRVGGLNVSYSIETQKKHEISEIKTVAEFGNFLKETGFRLEDNLNSLQLYIGGTGSCKVGSQLWGAHSGIGLWIQSNNLGAEISFNLPNSIEITGPKINAKIPAFLLSKENIREACKAAHT